jgi:hypothetical protein
MNGCETAHGLDWQQFHSLNVLRHHIHSIVLVFLEVMTIL